MYIAVDAMGGDYAPRAVVDGAFQAARDYGIAVLLVGDREKILYELERAGGQESSLVAIRHAAEAIDMGESPVAALRRKPDSSLGVAFQQVKTGEAGAVVSAGNTGAVLALAVTVLGNLAGVDRPAIVTVIPTLSGHAYLLDAGANVECKPLHLVQFAVMGEVYARVVRGVLSPRVGVLSNGEEDSKGTDATRGAHEMLKKLPLRYIGYVEGRDLNSGKVDVIVTDGFTGNVALKTMEGFSEFLQEKLRTVFTARWQNKLAYLLIRGSFATLRASLDPSEIGGAPLLGTDGLAIIAHGTSTPKAIKNAIRVADESLRRGINRQIVESLQALPETALLPAELKRGRKLWTQIKERFRHTRETHEPPLVPDPPAEEEKKE
ncbi:MAG: phosphate acyltransferase PlsX [Deltaproteobacteria bacterium]|nr:phosphate acyltransferase PlsX [Deltaproteobacteria bacterium]